MSLFAARRPARSEYAATPFAAAIDAVAGDNVLVVMKTQMNDLCELASSISVEQIDQSDAADEWTIRQVFEHLADAERVFGYRILRFAAGDPTPLPGWDQDAYASSRFGLGGGFTGLIEEIGALRHANLVLLRRIEPRRWEQVGTADGQKISVRVLAWLTAAHLQDHLRIVAARVGYSLASPRRLEA